ncbi:hypothetical protein [uncultured Variovorax sp.]|uniref:hypothetical protein n=1 Tax=uncultured Variovorax sp. TaxID=114708 RepID=UPI0025E7CB3D|nr:hypothetical protein [uncultured Variovorax sp.]
MSDTNGAAHAGRCLSAMKRRRCVRAPAGDAIQSYRPTGREAPGQHHNLDPNLPGAGGSA